MAIVPFMRFPSGAGSGVLITWTDLGPGDVGEATTADLAEFGHRTVQAAGDFGAGSVAIEGSLDGTGYAVLPNAQGSRLDLSRPCIQTVGAATAHVRPVVTSGSPRVTVTLLLRK